MEKMFGSSLFCCLNYENNLEKGLSYIYLECVRSMLFLCILLSVSVGYLNSTFTFTVLTRYYASLSGALAILNMIPCYWLDGQWTLLAFIEYFLPRFIKNDSIRAIIYHMSLVIGSTLLLVNFVFGIWNLRHKGMLSIFQESQT